MTLTASELATEPDVADIIAGALQTSRAHAYELMRSALASQSEEQGKDAWISVDDKLPEKNIEVMVFFEGASSLASTGQYTASKFDHDGWCYPKENFDDANDEWPTVTHWMPLPAAPVATPKEGA